MTAYTPRTADVLALGCVVAMLLGSVCRGDEKPMAAPDFNRDIRPILSNNCLHCHGPDDQDRQAGLRLDDVSAAMKASESGKVAIVPGKPELSQLIARIESNDDALRMPPADSNKHLTAAEKSLLKQWIAHGAATVNHWSLLAPLPPAVPVVKSPGWCRNEIDRFVLERLEREGLQPSPQADAAMLLRRVYLDLIGLPPTPDEADAFALDNRPDAYERVVEGLLESPHYGEHWARRWLDLARYADTNGYEKDRPRSIWPYRDWVIRALNADMPFDRFTIEQIAGDLLPGAGLDQRVATGFHRNTMVNEEGGIDVEEFRFYSVVDRVNTTGAVWLGLTIGCSQCHNHKFDPLTQREYYQLFALLNNADEEELPVPTAEIAQQRQAILAQIDDLTRQRDPQVDESKFAAWASEAAAKAQRWQIVAPAAVTSQGHATMTVLADGSVLASGDKPNQDTYTVDLPGPRSRVTAIRLEVLPHESLPQQGPGRAPLFSEGDFFLGEFGAAAIHPSDSAPVATRIASATHSYAADKYSAAACLDGDLDTGWSIKGRTGEAHQAVFVLEQPLELGPGDLLRLTLEQRYIHQMTIGRFRLSLSDAPMARATELPAEIEAILTVDPAQRSAADITQLRGYYASIAPELAEQNKAIVELRKKLPAFPTSLVMQERSAAQQRVTRLAHRGEFLSPRDPVTPGVPAVLHALPATAPPNRLSLARWLVDPRNPLVARVVMNRQWQAIFGRGLVRTSEDFGLRGEAPSHPELLDYLATQFVARGWSLKEMHRLIVTSATYRQRSSASAEMMARDPANVLLARGPRLRVEAEVVRDVALASSGLLNDQMGGPSVYPPQPAGVTDLAYGAGNWPTSAGADRFRRGLYTFKKRTSPYAAFTTFDAPSGETCSLRRERSNTPLQALTLLNDPAFVEVAQALARRVVGNHAAIEDRARVLFRQCLTRTPDEQELAALVAFANTQQGHLQGQVGTAASIAGCTAEEPRAIEWAVWTLTARAVMNLDEFVTKE